MPYLQPWSLSSWDPVGSPSQNRGQCHCSLICLFGSTSCRNSRWRKTSRDLLVLLTAKMPSTWTSAFGGEHFLVLVVCHLCPCAFPCCNHRHLFELSLSSIAGDYILNQPCPSDPNAATWSCSNPYLLLMLSFSALAFWQGSSSSRIETGSGERKLRSRSCSTVSAALCRWQQHRFSFSEMLKTHYWLKGGFGGSLCAVKATQTQASSIFSLSEYCHPRQQP